MMDREEKLELAKQRLQQFKWKKNKKTQESKDQPQSIEKLQENSHFVEDNMHKSPEISDVYQLEALKTQEIVAIKEDISYSEKATQNEIVTSSIGTQTDSFLTPTTSKRLSATSSPQASVEMNPDGALTARLLELETKISAQQEIITKKDLNYAELELKLERIKVLEHENARLHNELSKEQKLNVLLSAEVDSLPDMIQRFHEEREKLLKRVNFGREYQKVEIEEKVVKIGFQCSHCNGNLISL